MVMTPYGWKIIEWDLNPQTNNQTCLNTCCYFCMFICWCMLICWCCMFTCCCWTCVVACLHVGVAFLSVGVACAVAFLPVGVAFYLLLFHVYLLLSCWHPADSAPPEHWPPVEGIPSVGMHVALCGYPPQDPIPKKNQ